MWELDPGPLVGWSDVVASARLVRDVLKTLELASWVKTTGGRGLHVVAPLEPALDWSTCLAFAKHVSTAIVRTNPDLYTIKFAKQGRERRILIDYLRNNRTNTSICAYSPRAREGAPVSMPVAWSLLEPDPGRWTLLTVGKRLARARRDPWADYWTTAQRVSSAARRAVGRA